MRVIRRRALVWSGVLLAGLTAVVGTPRALGQEQVAVAEAPASFLSASDFSMQLWELARTGDANAVSSLLNRYADAVGHGVHPALQDASKALAGHLAKREEDRAARIATMSGRFGSTTRPLRASTR